MGQRFQITESERQRIKGLYEQPEQQMTNQGGPEQDAPRPVRGRLEIDDLVHAHITEYTVYVKVAGEEDSDDECIVTIKLDGFNGFKDAEIHQNYSDTISDDELYAFITRMGEEGAFDKLPTHMSWRMEEGKPFDFN